MKLKSKSSVSYASLILYRAHMEGQLLERTLDLVPGFRDYLHYHIKCSKAYLHTRMRKRVSLLLLLLNKAKPPKLASEKKERTAQGKYFVRK